MYVYYNSRMNDTMHKKNCQLKNVEFVKGITGEDPILNEPQPQIVVAGRSNAGKSSVINSLVNESLARVSSTPGKTQEINFYSIDGRAYLVDLPGYGYAKMSARQAEDMRKQMIWYLSRSEAPITLLVLVVDIRRGCEGLDRDLLDIASGEALPVVVVANKVDKCNQSERVAGKRKIEKDIQSHPEVLQGLVAFSTKTREGKNTLCEIIQSIYAN